jgi:hypothetical protein
VTAAIYTQCQRVALKASSIVASLTGPYSCSAPLQ